ncbi:CcdC family protein [Lentibacillus saliphilus]|uniref:CcdC family protein n=1 Tax=Lentibacillus saliphilus TaxID=2737028 RepID=UPI001C2FCA0F|nr:cytochrome c biogenesis protein CcdC [Lentibacillus saliphilus]
MFWIIASTVLAAFMAIFMIIIRMKAARKPVTVKKIIIPPIMMSTGALMFLFPVFRVPWTQVLEAVGVGLIFSLFLIKTSKFEIRRDGIYLIPSKAFAIVLIGLLAARIILKLVIGGWTAISLGEMSGMFFLLAFGMIITWRLAMLYQFQTLKKKLATKAPSHMIS